MAGLPFKRWEIVTFFTVWPGGLVLLVVVYPPEWAAALWTIGCVAVAGVYEERRFMQWFRGGKARKP